MEFKDYFRSDLEHIGCSLSDLSRVSGLSSAVLSRYRSGERIPRKDSELLVKLCAGLSQLESEAGIPSLGKDRLELYRTILSDDVLLLSEHFDALLRSLQISMKDLSRDLNYDASYLSRIRSGKRSPSDPELFAGHVARVLVENGRDVDLEIISDLIQADSSEPLEKQLKQWLLQKDHQQTAEISSFLARLDEFNLEEFIRLLQFGEDVPVENLEFPFKPARTLQEMRQSELDFLTATANGEKTGEIFMCNEMPMTDMAQNSEFLKRWMSLISFCLKKGNHLSIIHDISRPFSEMMLGLEGWVPVYMTGKVTPFYLPEETNSIYRHVLYVSEEAMLLAECIRGKAENGMTILSNNKKAIRYGRQRAQDILSYTKPLMKIFRADHANEHEQLWESEIAVPGSRSIASSMPPIWTLTADLLARILSENNIGEEEAEKIEAFRKKQLTHLNSSLYAGPVSFTMPRLSREEFEAHVPILFLTQLFSNLSIRYSWESYQKHIQLTQDFAETSPNFSFFFDENFAFRNLSIYTRNDRFAALLKSGNPEISFVITHPKMVKAIRNFAAPFAENE